MAQFRAIIEGSRGPASRLGGKSSGIQTFTNGWNCGVSVRGYHKNGKDYFNIDLTSGSGYSGKSKTLGTFTADDLDT